MGAHSLVWHQRCPTLPAVYCLSMKGGLALQTLYPYARAAGGLYANAANTTCASAVLAADAAADSNTTSVTDETVQSVCWSL